MTRIIFTNDGVELDVKKDKKNAILKISLSTGHYLSMSLNRSDFDKFKEIVNSFDDSDSQPLV